MQKELSCFPYLMQFSSPASKWGSSGGSGAVPSAGPKIPTPQGLKGLETGWG